MKEFRIMVLRIPFFALVLSLFLFSCKDETSEITSPSSATTLTNVAYGNDPLQTMDVYLPAQRNANSTPVLILLHGGAWYTGDKSGLNFFIRSLQNAWPELAIVNMNYRLAKTSGENIFPAQEEDIVAAMKFLQTKTSEYNISNIWGIGGESAGGHIAMSVAYEHQDAFNFRFVTNFYGPSDLALLYNSIQSTELKLSINSLLNGTPDTNAEVYYNNSPINFVTPASAPTVIFQGADDAVVPASQQTQLKAKLDAQRVYNELYIYPEQGHGFTADKLNESMQTMISFMKRYVDPGN